MNSSPTTRSAAVAVAVALGCIAVMAATLGFVSPDSWAYLELAESLRSGRGCTIGGEYFAVFPCGYALVIAGISPAQPAFATLIYVSKACNFLLLFGSFLLLASATRRWAIAAFVVLNPVTLYIYAWTWSENLFLFALAGVTYAIVKIDESREWPVRWVSLLAFFLLIGCSARYFFSPYSVVLFASAWIAFGRRTALRALPAFAVAGLCVVAYQAFNFSATGFGTGVARSVAPESLVLLLIMFFKAIGRDGAFLAVLVGGLLIVLPPASVPSPPRRFLLIDRGDDAKLPRFLFFSGLGYLSLMFILRSVTFFDMFDTRTLGYGTVLLVTSILWPRLAVAIVTRRAMVLLTFLGLSSGALAHGSAIPKAIAAGFSDGWRSPRAALFAYAKERPRDPSAIAYFRVPDVSRFIVGNATLFYGGANPRAFPLLRYARYGSLESEVTMRARLSKYAGTGCAIDYSSFRSREELDSFLSLSYTVGLRFESGALWPARVMIPEIDPSVKAVLMKAYVERGSASCSLPPTEG